MSEQERYAVARRLAALLLLQERELGVSDIASLPFADDPRLVEAIIADLAREYGAVESERRIPGALGAWERTLRMPSAIGTQTLVASR
jgi:hypothetical protein